ncbi:MAG: undecaprenyl-diphosphate phosphatase [Alphaproteobacteria bacterium]|nr:undecaprenyl-diphosphate phosphatase [Alphaproteobacteria bacterium]
MSLTQIIVLAVVQGLTEFLPISSSGHLALVPMLTQWPDQGLPMDVAVHVGTMFAVIIYFWRDLWAMAVGLLRFLRGKRDPAARLAIQIIVATIPVLAAAWAFEKYVGDAVRAMAVIGWTTLGYGILLFVADRACMTVKKVEHASYSDALVIGLAQILALVPGTSRSGITMTAARILGYERPEAAKFSFLMSVPTIAAGGMWLVLKLREAHDTQLTDDALLAMALSFVTGLFAIAFMMRWLRRSTFTPFVIYRILLGAVVLGLAYGVI